MNRGAWWAAVYGVRQSPTRLKQLSLASPLDWEEIQPVHPKGDQSWVFIGRIDVEAETLKLWPPDAKSWLIWKDPDAGKDWKQEEKGTTENEMVGWYHQLDGHGFGWTPGVGDGQGGLARSDSWGCRVRHDWATEMNWTELRRGNGNSLTPVYLPGKSHGQRSLVGYSPWGHKELDMTEHI